MTPADRTAYMRRFREALEQASSKEALTLVARIIDEPAFEALAPKDAESLLIAYNHRWAVLSGSAVWS